MNVTKIARPFFAVALATLVVAVGSPAYAAAGSTSTSKVVALKGVSLTGVSLNKATHRGVSLNGVSLN